MTSQRARWYSEPLAYRIKMVGLYCEELARLGIKVTEEEKHEWIYGTPDVDAAGAGSPRTRDPRLAIVAADGGVGGVACGR